MSKLIKGFVSLFYANNIPTTDSHIANDNGDLCWDGNSDDVYVASNVGAATTTWTKIVD